MQLLLDNLESVSACSTHALEDTPLSGLSIPPEQISIGVKRLFGLCLGVSFLWLVLVGVRRIRHGKDAVPNVYGGKLLHSPNMPIQLLSLQLFLLALALLNPKEWQMAEVLGALALIYAVVALVDIRVVHSDLQSTMIDQKEMKHLLSLSSGAEYVRQAVELYEEASDCIVTVTRLWGDSLERPTRARIKSHLSDYVRRCKKKKKPVQLIFSGPIRSGPDFPKVLWRWSVLKKLGLDLTPGSKTRILHHEDMDVVFTLVDKQLILGWADYRRNLLGRRIDEELTVNLFRTISERWLEGTCPGRSLLSTVPRPEPCVAGVPISCGVERMKQVIRETQVFQISSLLLKLSEADAHTVSFYNHEYEFRRNLIYFLEQEMAAKVVNGEYSV